MRPFVLSEIDGDLREALISNLLFAAGDFAARFVVKRDPHSLLDHQGATQRQCLECGVYSAGLSIPHLPSCGAGRILLLLDSICAIGQSNAAKGESPRPESSGDRLSDVAAERALACVAFCAGIPTEILQRELPLASNRRMRWHEIKHLRVALPWLPAVEL